MPRISVADRRAALVEAALRVIARGGVSAATTRAIVAEAEMSLASFHYAFSSHDELMAEVATWIVQGEQGAVLPEEIATGTLQEVVHAGLRRYLDHMRADPQSEQATLELALHALRAPDMQELARRQYAQYRELATAALTFAATHTGSVWDRPVDEVARLLVVLTDGLTTTWLVDRDDAAADALIDNAARIVAGLAHTA